MFILKKWSKKQVSVLVGSGLLICLLITGMFVWNTSEDEEVMTNAQLLQQASPKEENAQEQVQEEVVKKVDVKGAILKPGVYLAEKDERILDMIEKAGGFTAKADQNAVNLAQRVEDQMLIYVPTKGENPSAIISPTNGAPSSVGTAATNGEEKVNLNSATEDALQTIQGIGPAKAKAIIQYRTEKGRFSSIEELKEVSGIGDKTFEKMKDQITI